MSNLLKIFSVAALSSIILAGCSDDSYIIDADGQALASRSSVRATVATSSIDDNMLNNICPYIFNGADDGTRGEFYGIPNSSVITSQRAIDMTMRPGKWDLTLVTAPVPVKDLLLQPSHGQKASNAKMFVHKAVDGILPDMVELYTSLVKDVTVTNEPAGLVNDFQSPVYFLRNYSRVRVVLDYGKELSDDPDAQKVYLSNIPSTLNWEGGLYPSAQNPDIAAEPMASKAFTTEIYTHELEEGVLKQIIRSTNELVYLVPAHRGSDYLNDNPVDTATSKININFNFTAVDGTPVSKTDVPVNLVPRPNSDMVIHVSYEKRQLAVYAEIIPWTEHDATASVGAQHVKVDKTSIQLAWKDTLHVDCDRPFTVTRAAEATWLTINKLSDGFYEVVANVDTYVDNNPRTSYINVTSGNYTKRIPVTQRPERGTIKVNLQGQPNVKELWLSPPHNSKNVTVTSVGGDWTTLASLRLNGIKTGNAGVTNNVAITRVVDDNVHYDDYQAAFGRGPVVFKNKKTLDTDTLWVDNLFIGADDDVVEIAQPTSQQDTVTTTSHVVVYGGSQDVTIISLPDFIPSGSYNVNTKTFTFVSRRHPTGDDQWGDIILAHKTDPDYRVTIPVDQAILVVIPEFDYFVVKYIWDTGSGDVDIKVGFQGNPTTVSYRNKTYNTSAVNGLNGIYVGYSWQTTTTFLGQTCLQWGGDATQGQGETVFFNARNINTYPYPGQKGVETNTTNLIPRVVSFSCNASWWSSVPSNWATNPITCQITCYLNGTMVKGTTNDAGSFNNKNFYNQGGTLVFTATRAYTSNTKVSGGSYLHFCDIEYDRKKHTANIKWDGATWIPK